MPIVFGQSTVSAPKRIKNRLIRPISNIIDPFWCVSALVRPLIARHVSRTFTLYEGEIERAGVEQLTFSETRINPWMAGTCATRFMKDGEQYLCCRSINYLSDEERTLYQNICVDDRLPHLYGDEIVVYKIVDVVNENNKVFSEAEIPW